MAGLYDYDKDLASVIAKITRSDLSEQNKKLILGFREDCVLRGLSKPRIVKCLTNLKRLAEWLSKDFDKADKEYSDSEASSWIFRHATYRRIRRFSIILFETDKTQKTAVFLFRKRVPTNVGP